MLAFLASVIGLIGVYTIFYISVFERIYIFFTEYNVWFGLAFVYNVSMLVLFSPMVRETWVQSQVESYQRLKKWYLMPPCLTLSIIRYGTRVKWSNPGKGVAPSPTPWCSKLSKMEPSGHRRLWSPTLLLLLFKRTWSDQLVQFLLVYFTCWVWSVFFFF